MNEPLGIALELMQRRRALAARLAPLARRLAFPDYYERAVAKRVIVQPRIVKTGTDWTRLTKEDKAIAAQDKASVVVNTCARIWGVPSGQIYDAGRKAIYVRPRQAAMMLMIDMLRLSQPVTGLILNRDHTTVIYGMRSHEVHYATRADYRQRYDQAEAELRELLKNTGEAARPLGASGIGRSRGFTTAPLRPVAQNGATSDTAPADDDADAGAEPVSRASSADITKRAA